MLNIGIPVSTSNIQFYINQAYVHYLQRAGLNPVLITPRINENKNQCVTDRLFEEQNFCNTEKPFVENLDGLLLPGGIDIDPIFYLEDNYASFSIDPEKDYFERQILHEAILNRVPIFGICRGFQLIMRELLRNHKEMEEHFEFTQHIQDHTQKSQELNRSRHQHFVDFIPRHLYNLEDKENNDIYSYPVNSLHHQCVVMGNFENFVNTGNTPYVVKDEIIVRPVAWTDRGIKDKNIKKQRVCEAIKIENWGPNILAVQWHPEELVDLKLLSNFFSKHTEKHN